MRSIRSRGHNREPAAVNFIGVAVMKAATILGRTLLGMALLAGSALVAAALPIDPAPTKSRIDAGGPSEFVLVRGGFRGGGIRAGGVRAGGFARQGNFARVNRGAVVNRGAKVNRNAVVNRNTVVNRNRIVTRNTAVVRPWVRPGGYWWRPGGAIAAGAAVGFVTAATAAAWAGPPPGPNMCWYYTDQTRTQGFWDVCQ
jgi:hypothetical protein